MSDLEVRGPLHLVAMRRALYAQVVALDAKCFEAPWDARFFRSLECQPGARFIVAVEAGATSHDELVHGLALCMNLPSEMLVAHVAVAPEAQGCGLAKRLLQDALDHFAARGGGVAFLEVAESNAPAQSVYHALGFNVVGRRIGYYMRGRANALIMMKQQPPIPTRRTALTRAPAAT